MKEHMYRAIGVGAILFCAATLSVMAKDDKLDTPPDGISPSTVTLSQILKAYDAAAGRVAGGVDDTRRELWHFSKAGLSGSETLVRNGLDFHSKISSGSMTDEYGQFLDHRWHKDANGMVSPMEGIDPTSFEMLITLRNFGDAEDPKNDVKVLGESADPPAYVLQVNRPDYKHPEWVYYDKKTGLIDRIVDVVDDRRMTISYDDYRATKGLTQPWHVHLSDGRTILDDDFKRSSLEIGLPVATTEFIMPPSTPNFASYSGHVDVPGTVLFDTFGWEVGLDRYQRMTAPTVIVRVNVNGRGLDFELSSGSPDSLIDWDVAHDLNLPAFGRVTRSPSGDPVPYDTVVPQLQIGGLTLHNFAMYALPFNYHMEGSKVVGTLGYDVLKSGVFKIDYDNRKITLEPVSAFDGPNPVPGAFAIPLHFDQGFAFMEGLLDSVMSENILLDNSFELSFVFGNFTSKHPQSVKDTYGRQHGTAVVPFADSSGYGRKIDIWMGNIPDIQFGQAHFINYQMLGTDGDVAFTGHEVDAVVGADFLQYYDVYLDYAHNRVLMKPNASFLKVFHV